MKLLIAGILIPITLAFSAAVILPVGTAAAEEAAVTLSNATVEKMALMPFLMMELESPNQPIARPLNKPLMPIETDGIHLVDGADRVLNAIVQAELQKRFADRLVPMDVVAAACESVCSDDTLDTPRKRAVRLGQIVGANLVMVGTVWRYREKGDLAESPDSPASVGMALYLVDVNSGVRLWQRRFDGTQKALTDDVLGGIKQLGMGMRWLSAEELARYGTRSILRALPLE